MCTTVTLVLFAVQIQLNLQHPYSREYDKLSRLAIKRRQLAMRSNGGVLTDGRIFRVSDRARQRHALRTKREFCYCVLDRVGVKRILGLTEVSFVRFLLCVEVVKSF